MSGPAVGTRWSGPAGQPVRLDLTLRPDAADPGQNLWHELREIQRSLPGCVRVLVLRGLSGLPEVPATYDWTSQPSCLSVAVVDGVAQGPAFDLALAADLRVVTPEAMLSRPGPVAVGALQACVGYSRALDLLVTGRAVSGSEALELGLAQRLASAADLDDALETLVADLLAPDRDLVRELKALLIGAATRGAAAQRDAQAEAMARLKSFDPDGAPSS